MSAEEQPGSGGPTSTVDEEPVGIPIDTSSSELSLDSNDFERVTLMDLPKIAKYGTYELLGRIAYGGMAEIFLARELGGDGARRMVVVKRVLPHVAEDPHFVEMFRDEARLAMQLNHPQICHVYTFGEAEDTYYLAMEWVNGKPLSKIIKRARKAGGLPIPIALKVIAQVAEALDYAHRACDPSGEPLGIVHRDVSPQNIMVSYDGVVKLLDFGIAKATSHSTRTEAGVIKGKFAYMSPQQCVGEPIDARADLFALGICLFEAVAGKNPFRRKTEFETMTKIVGDPTPDLLARRPEAPEALAEIVEKALMKQPERRFQSGGEMQLALEQALAASGQLVNSARVGDYLKQLFAEEVRDGPSLDMRIGKMPSHSSQEALDESPRRSPPGSTELDAVPVPVPTPSAQPTKKKSSGAIFWVLAMLVVFGGLVAAAGVIGWTFWEQRVDTPPIAVNDPPPTLPAPSAPQVQASPPASPLAEPPPPTTRGSIFVESDPPGATVTFDGNHVAGETPFEIGLVEAGVHDILVRLDGHEDWEGRVVVVAGRRATITADLTRERRAVRAAGPPGQLSLNTRPWSKVYLGRRLLGTTPIGRVEVPSGNVRLRLVDRDGTEHRRALRVPPGEHVTESFNLRE